MDLWSLPTTAKIGGKEYDIHTDFREVLKIVQGFSDPDIPEWIRWHIAVKKFFVGEIPTKHIGEAMEYLSAFISYSNDKAEGVSGPILMDWEQDTKEIVADVNKVAGIEIRSVPYMHWWTFLSYFHAIGEGQFSTIVSIRAKLKKGKTLEKWEKEFYHENKDKIDLKKRYSAEEIAEQKRLKALLGE